MRRVARPVFTILAALSLLLCVVTCVLWARSYWISDQAGWVGQDRAIAIISSGGSVGFYTDKVTAPLTGNFIRALGFSHYHFRQMLDLTERSFAGITPRGGGGFAIVAGQSGPASLWMLVVPIWFFAGMFAVGPIIWALRWRKRRRRERAEGNFCVNCGYDLRASPERCPECGRLREMQKSE